MNMTHLEFMLLVLVPIFTVSVKLAISFGVALIIWSVAAVLRSFARWIDRR